MPSLNTGNHENIMLKSSEISMIDKYKIIGRRKINSTRETVISKSVT
jgi:hypothetical protein